MATSLPSPYDASTSCKISEKLNEQFSRKSITTGRMDARAGLILKVPRVTIGEQKVYKTSKDLRGPRLKTINENEDNN